MSFPGSKQMKYTAELLTSIAWWTLHPDDRLLVEQPGAFDVARHVSASRSESGDLALIHRPVGGEVKLKPGILADGLKAEWFDPRTGLRSAAQAAAPETFRAPEEQDWVFVLQTK